MSYNVPNWDLDDVSVPARFDLRPPFSTSNSTDAPLLAYGMEELTWENGQLIVNGLGLGLAGLSSQTNQNSSATAKEEAWEKPRAAVGTLESIVDLATHKMWLRPPPGKGSEGDDIDVPLLHRPAGSHRDPVSSAEVSVTSDMDALVPCGIPNEEEQVPPPTSTCSTRVEQVEGSVLKKARLRATRVPVTGYCSMIQQSQSGSGGDSGHVRKVDTCEKDSGGFGLTTASFCSQGRTLSLSSTEKPAGNTKTTTDDHDDSACLTRPQGDTCDKEDKKKEIARSSSSTKRSRAAIHNQSERKRRETINQKMKTLQKMVPNSSKTDKASMLDEVIDYLKQLKAQVQMMMMSRMNIPSMMMPFAMPQHPLHMPMMPPMGMGMGMGMNMNMNIINSAIMAHQNLAGLSPVLNPNSAFMPTAAPWGVATERSTSSSTTGPTDPSTYLANCQSQPMTMEAYNRMVALIQQQQQQLASTTSKN